MARGREGSYYTQPVYTVGGDVSARAQLIDRLAIIAAGGAGEFTPANAALLARLSIIAAGGAGELTPARTLFIDAAITSREARPAVLTYGGQAAWASNGVNAALLDTGALAAGEYEIIARAVTGESGGGAGVPIGRADLEHRNAANAANVTTEPLNGEAGTNNFISTVPQSAPPIIRRRVTLAANERIRINKVVADTGTGRSAYSLQVRAV